MKRGYTFPLAVTGNSYPLQAVSFPLLAASCPNMVINWLKYPVYTPYLPCITGCVKPMINNGNIANTPGTPHNRTYSGRLRARSRSPLVAGIPLTYRTILLSIYRKYRVYRVFRLFTLIFNSLEYPQVQGKYRVYGVFLNRDIMGPL